MMRYRDTEPCEECGEGATGMVDREGNVLDGSVENYEPDVLEEYPEDDGSCEDGRQE